MDPAVQAAFVAVVRRQDERKEGVALLKRQDEHTAMRMVEKKAEKERKEAAAVGDAIYFYHMERAQTVAALDSLLRRKKSGQAAIELLLRQTRQRTAGCALKGKYSFEISMYSVETKVSDRRQATHAQLRRMIKEETDPETREALQSPAQLPVASRFNPPKLGRITKLRLQHEQAAAARLAALEETDDDEELAALDEKYMRAVFYDDGEHRTIQSIEWNDRYDRFQAITAKIYAPGHKEAGVVMMRPSVVAYGLSERERPEMDRMMAEHSQRERQREDMSRKRKRKRQGNQKKQNASRRRGRARAR